MHDSPRVVKEHTGEMTELQMNEHHSPQVDGDTQLTVRDAYLAMFEYLVNRWETNSRPEFLTALLGDVDPTTWKMSNLPPDALPTGDPATWYDWLDAVRRVLAAKG